MQNKINISINGLSVTLTIILCILKKAEILNISWLWCLCPIWIDLVIIFIVLIITGIIIFLRK
jgi:hypothetical protein